MSPAWKYEGAYPSDSRDIANVGYIADRIAALNLAQSSVDSMIAAGLAGYADKTYVDARDALNATKAFVDAGDATRLHLSQIGQNNGVLGLDINGHVPLSQLNIAAAQNWPDAYNSPSSTFTSATAFTTESTLYPMTVADPGYPYKLVLFGLVDAKTNTDGEYPVVRVRAGNATTGPIVGLGYGNAEHYSYTNLVSFLSAGSNSYTPQSTNLIAAVLGAGGGGGEGGAGGKAGSWAGSALTVSLGTVLTAVVGTQGFGGAATGSVPSAGSAGTASSLSGAGFTTLTGAGGLGGATKVTATAGGTPPDFTVGGQTFEPGVGGAAGTASTLYGSDGGPGAGGGGGFKITSGGITTWYSGGNGGDGAVLIAEQTPPGSGDPDNAAPVDIIPVPLGLQSVLTGSVVLYVNVVRSGTVSTVTANPFHPNLWAVPVRA